ncbi:MAG: hypothetical protein ABFR90_04875 [Planctomycetota bacterium]
MNNEKRFTNKITAWFIAVGFLLNFAGVGIANAGLPAGEDEYKETLFSVCSAEQYQFTQAVRQAFLAYAKAQAKADLQTRGKSLPDAFLAWVDSDPEIQAGVYGTRLKASDVLLVLYSLRLDLGQTDFEKYRHLTLAMALVHAHKADTVNIHPHSPIKLAIGGDPRIPVNTKNPNRKWDINDHIINFLNDNTITEEVVVGHKQVTPELKYDDRGIAIPAPKKSKPKKMPIKEKRSRSLKGADVIASRELQKKFNAYMKARGHDVSIDCGEKIVHWKSRDMVAKDQRKRIGNACNLFRAAYEAKGLLPKKRDPFPAPGEKCAYLIRNDKYRFPPELQKDRKWPRFPLTAPWPLLMMLAEDSQPLREREERWTAFRDKGEFKTYGEYIGKIAQQFDMQSARRLAPYPFTYGSIQMKLKDGGVCGTMGNIGARSHIVLGIPACTAGQPGHCAMVAYLHDPKTDTYQCKGRQYATGGDDKTTPHSRWLLQGGFDSKKGAKIQRRPMVYHKSIAWAVNYDMKAYMDSMMVDSVFALFDESKRNEHGIIFLESGLALNPYNFLLTNAIQELATTSQEQVDFWTFYEKTMGAVQNRPGCPANGLYNKTVKVKMFRKIAILPVPEDKQVVREILMFLRQQQCDIPAAEISYRLVLEGLRPLMAHTVRDFAKHLKTIHSMASRGNETASAKMAETIKAVADCIEDEGARKEWALFLWKRAQGHEKYFGHKYRISTDASILMLAKLSGQKMPPDSEMMKPILRQITLELRRSVKGRREVGKCRMLASKIKSAAGSLKNAEQKQRWLEMLSKIMTGHETFKPNEKANAQRDPCLDVISEAIKSKKNV